ncbi:CoA transferase [Streptomyces monticola]|uniref:CoA transferase n=1 Tax=Streptomyces monticola TaxID=2666263 RepID=A0ABW2JMR5_9ACTN
MEHMPADLDNSAAVSQAWAALGGDPALLSRVTYESPGGGLLAARLPVLDAARACAAVCALAGAEHAARHPAVPRVHVDDGAVATAFVSERQLRVDGRAPTSFAPLSRFWRTADGWVRTHANYPHHREALLRALGVPEERVGDELAARRALDVEEAVYAAGGLAVALRTRAQWQAHAQGAAVAAHPLLTRERLDETPPPASGRPARARRAGLQSARARRAGFRVLDLTRVLAGPVATRTLALLGADVLRIDAPQLPELADQHADTGFGKRSALLDLGRTADRTTFDELLAEADVVVTGYRPGALDRFGLSPEALAERRRGLVVAQVSAWGDYGPWAGRRGFDSLVQVGTGIADAERPEPSGPPGALPAQALDHGTGYLLAAAVLRSLTEQEATGGTRLVRLALAQTAHWLQSLPREPVPEREAAPSGAPEPEAAPNGPYDPGVHLAETDSALGRLRYALPPVTFEGSPVNWAHPPGRWGADTPSWQPEEAGSQAVR